MQPSAEQHLLLHVVSSESQSRAQETPQRLRSSRLSLPKQVAQETQQRLERPGLPLPQQLARKTPQGLWNNDPKTQNIHTTVTMSRTREKGDNSDRWQHEDVLDSSIYNTAPVPGGVASGQTHQNVRNLCSLAPFFHHRRCGRTSSVQEETGRKRQNYSSCSVSLGELRASCWDGRPGIHSFTENIERSLTNFWTVRNSGGRGEERVAGGASRAASPLLFVPPQSLSGHQPRVGHDANDPLLLAPQKKRTSNFLRVLVFLLLPQQSAGWTSQRRKIGGKTTDMQVRRRRGVLSAHKPLASMELGVRDDSAMSHLMSAQPGNFHLGGSSPHWRPRTLHFVEIGEKCEKNTFKRLIIITP